MKLLLATRNKHKMEEIASIFQIEDLELETLADHPELPEVVEDRETFEGNSVKKATELARLSGIAAMADDSGLEVDALDGAPGVYSARYSGTHGDDSANNRKLLRKLEGEANRTARFRCVISLANPDGNCESVEGVCEGQIAIEPSGSNGFGYDPVFMPTGWEKTFAEMDSQDKNAISHRAKALEKAKAAWFAAGE